MWWQGRTLGSGGRGVRPSSSRRRAPTIEEPTGPQPLGEQHMAPEVLTGLRGHATSWGCCRWRSAGQSSPPRLHPEPADHRRLPARRTKLHLADEMVEGTGADIAARTAILRANTVSWGEADPGHDPAIREEDVGDGTARRHSLIAVTAATGCCDGGRRSSDLGCLDRRRGHLQTSAPP